MRLLLRAGLRFGFECGEIHRDGFDLCACDGIYECAYVCVLTCANGRWKSDRTFVEVTRRTVIINHWIDSLINDPASN